MKIISACLLILLLIFLFLPPTFARTEYNLPKVTQEQIAEAMQNTIPLRFLPSHPIYFLLQIKEYVNRLFQPSSAKRAQFDSVLATKRIKESHLMLEKNDTKKASKSLKRYSQRIEKMVRQIEKARSQNQDVVPLISHIAEDLKNHETFLSATVAKWQLMADEYNFDENLTLAINSLTKAISTIDNVKPGLKDRFKLSNTSQEPEVEDQTPATPSSNPSEIFQSSPSAKPRRIIY